MRKKSVEEKKKKKMLPRVSKAAERVKTAPTRTSALECFPEGQAAQAKALRSAGESP